MKKLTILSLVVIMVLSLTSLTFAKTTIKVAHFYDPMGGGNLTASYEWFENAITGFEDEYPDIEVKMEIFKWDQIDVKAMSDYRANIKDHDVFLTSPQLMAQHKQVGDLADLTPYLAQWSDEKMEKFNWSAVWEKTKIGDEYLGLPLGGHTRTLLYNREMFEEVGLDPEQPPQDLEQLVDYAKKLTRDTDDDGKTDIWGLNIYLGPERATMEIGFAPILWHYGGQLWDPETKEADFASEAGVKAVQFLYDLIHVHEVTPKWVVSGSNMDTLYKPVIDGNFAMAWGWGSYWIQPLEDKGWTEGVFPPSPEGKAKVMDIAVTPTDPQAQFSNAWFISMYKLSQNKDAAWKFINYILNPEYLKDYPDAGLPARSDIWQAPEYQTEFYQTWQEALSKGKPMPPTAHYGALADTVAAALQDILVNGADVEETLQTAEDDFNAKYAGQ